MFSSVAAELLKSEMSSANDKAVLDAIFNPLLPTGECDLNDDLHADQTRPGDSGKLFAIRRKCSALISTLLCSRYAADAPDVKPLTEDELCAKSLELEGVQAAEKGDLERALRYFDEAVSKAPGRASAFNNRAQALRLKGDTEGKARNMQCSVDEARRSGRLLHFSNLVHTRLFCPARSPHTKIAANRWKGALADLEKAIELSASRGEEVARKKALCQRALLHRLQGKDVESRADLEAAAALGSDFAKTQLVALNPYAALCNQMLGDMFAKMQRGETCDDANNCSR